MRISDWSSDVCSSDLDGRFDAVSTSASAKRTASPGGQSRPMAPSPVNARNAGISVTTGVAPQASASRSEYPQPSARLPDTNRSAERISRSEEHTSELQSLMRTSYAVLCLTINNNNNN